MNRQSSDLFLSVVCVYGMDAHIKGDIDILVLHFVRLQRLPRGGAGSKMPKFVHSI
jgi:hypothetical protein